MLSLSRRIAQAIASIAACAVAAGAQAKPIAFAHGTTVMGEYGAGTMTEVQAFYAPTFRYSLGVSHLALDSAIDHATRDVSYVRANYLPKRWNFESAQGNAFVWGGVGRAHIGGTGDDQFAWNVGGQLDYETRRVYASLRTDLHEASAYSHRIDTLQLGVAPYEHDYQTLAVWFVIQARQYTGELFHGTEYAALLRPRRARHSSSAADLAERTQGAGVRRCGGIARAERNGAMERPSPALPDRSAAGPQLHAAAVDQQSIVGGRRNRVCSRGRLRLPAAGAYRSLMLKRPGPISASASATNRYSVCSSSA